MTKSAALGGEPSALGSNLLGPNLALQVAGVNKAVVADGGTIAVAMIKEGLFNSEARKAKWVKALCTTTRAQSD